MKKIQALFAIALIVFSIAFNGCARGKTRVAAWPGYFEMQKGSIAVAQMNFGEGVKDQPIKADRIYYCYDQETQEDFLRARQKGGV